MLTALARFVVRRRKAVLVASLAFFVARRRARRQRRQVAHVGRLRRHRLGVVPGPAAPRAGVRHPGAPARAAPHHPRRATVDDPAVAAAGTALTERVGARARRRAGRSRTGRSATHRRCRATRAARRWCSSPLRGDDDQVRDTAKRISAEYTGTERSVHDRRRRPGRGLPPGRHADREGPDQGRVDRAPDHADPAHPRVRQRGRRRASRSGSARSRSSARSSCCGCSRRSPTCRSSP